MRYWLLYVPGHPHASRQGRVLEHRIVMERELGRVLERHEVVHHLNGDPSDNRPENLAVMTQAEHARLHHEESIRSGTYRRPPGRPAAVRIQRSCPTCGTVFEAVGKKQAGKTYCSQECYWSCGLVGAARLKAAA